MKRVISIGLVISLILSFSIPVFGANTGYSTVSLTVEDDSEVLAVSIPVEIPLRMNLNGEITVPDDLKIINQVEDKAIEIISVKAEGLNDWSTANFDEDFSVKEIDTKEFSFSFNGDKMDNEGQFVLTEENWIIEADSSLNLEMDAKIVKQSEASSSQIAKVGFTIDWYEENVESTSFSVEYENGLMLPGSTNTATFSWESTVEGNELVSVVSQNPDIAEVGIPQVLNEPIEGTQTVNVIAHARGTVQVVGTLTTGETVSFTVNVSELSSTEEPLGSVNADISEEIGVGDSLNPEDITVTLPIVKSDGSTENVTVTPDEVEDVVLSEGENEVEVTVDVNGKIIVIIIIVYVESEVDPSTVITGISVKTPPTQTEYNVGEDFDSTGLILIVTYQDNHTEEIDSGFTVLDGSDLTKNKTFVTVEYSDKTCEVPITVDEIVYTDLILTSDYFESAGIDKTANEIIIPETFEHEGTYYRVVGIGDWALSSSSATKIVVPETVKSFGTCAFYDTSNLKEINIPEGVTVLPEYVFGWTGLETIILHNNLIEIGKSVFAESSIKTIEIPNSVTTIGNGAFSSSDIINITIPSSVTSFGSYVFQDCNSLQSAVINANITELNGTFAGCTSLTSVKLPNTLQTIKNFAFQSCTSLRNITIPDSVKSFGSTTGVFDVCTSLESIVIPDGVSELPLQMFYNCTSLKEIVIPSSVTYIGEKAFSNCTSLNTIYFKGSQSEWNSIGIAPYGHGISDSVSIVYNYSGD